MYSALKERLDIFHEKSFVLYAIGYMISDAGSGMQFLASSWLVLQLSGSNASVAFLLIFSALPGIFLSPIIGICADRLDRRFLAVSVDLFRMLVTAVIFVLWGTNQLQAWHLYLMAFLIAIGDQVYIPATTALMRELLSEEQLLSANATVAMMIQLGTAFGVGCGGMLMALYSPGAAIGLNALSYLISAICLLNTRRGYHSPASSATPNPFLHDLRDGIGYVRQHLAIVPLYIVLLTFTMTIAVINTLLVPFATSVLKVGTPGLGTIDACFAIGAVVGGILLPLLRYCIGEKRLMVYGVVATGLCVLFFAFAQGLLAAMVANFCIGVFIETRIFYNTSVQRRVDPDYQGRVYATFATFFALITLVIYLGMGLLQEVLSQRYLYSLQGVVLLLVALIVARPKDLRIKMPFLQDFRVHDVAPALAPRLLRLWDLRRGHDARSAQGAEKERR
ncbi:MFS transporter [Ktedonobacter robiniae]|uniref:MFS transporter n=1 Tax=Ktedonobacter robiniae TaxID=2778365 RepID=A0ABQ3V338_9CHLR|nr:MFS transporter [Ktedonobacter robiniae]GHO59408.1 MFS transporter [Ktedonobacter robiniae]